MYTAEEVTARETAARAAVEGEYKPKLDDVTAKLTEAEKAAAQRAGQFAHFRKLSDEQVEQLAEKDRIIYNNTLLLQEQQEKNVAAAKVAHDNAVVAEIRSRVGTDQKLFEEAKKMYEMIGIDDTTPEGVKARAMAALGALVTTQPDLIASAGFAAGGGFIPPVTETKKSFADTDEGKALANDLGLIVELPKK